MNKKQLFALLATPLLPFALCQVQGTIVFAEDFAGFSEGDLGGQNGWSAGSDHQIETGGGLSFESGPVSHLGGDNFVRKTGTSEAYAHINFGAQSGDSLYLSFLFNRDDGDFFMLGFTEGSPGSSVAGAGGRFASGGSGVRGRIGSNVFSGGTREEDEFGGSLVDTILYVGKLSKSEPGGNFDTFSFMFNPDSLSEPSDWDDGTDTLTVEFDTGLDSVDTLWFRSGSGGNDWSVDMLRVGTSYDAVVIPEPSTYAALIGLLALGLVVLRRRRR